MLYISANIPTAVRRPLTVHTAVHVHGKRLKTAVVPQKVATSLTGRLKHLVAKYSLESRQVNLIWHVVVHINNNKYTEYWQSKGNKYTVTVVTTQLV